MFNSLSVRNFVSVRKLVSVALLTFTFACSATYIRRCYRTKRKCRCTKRFTRDDCVLIIGGGHSIAFKIAMEVVRRGGRVMLANRALIIGARMKSRIIHKLKPETNSIMLQKLAFTSFDQIKHFVDSLRIEFETFGINRLAGVVFAEELRGVPFELTEDVFDRMFQVNYLGPFLLIQCLESLLKNHPDPRIIFLSSGESSPCKYSDIAEAIVSPRTRIEDRNLAYHISKVCLALMSLNWRGAHCVDPGSNVGFNLPFLNKPLRGFQGVLHALLQPSDAPSYKIMENDISSFVKLKNDNGNVLCGLLYKESIRHTYFFSRHFE